MQKTKKLIESDHVDFIVGYIWSNVAARLAQAADRFQDHHHQSPTPAPSQIRRPIVLALRFFHLLAERPDAAAIGLYMNEKGVKSAFLMGPNYIAGKDMLHGVQPRPSKARSSARN